MLKMDDDSQEDKPTHSTISRYRSPIFSKDEVKELLNLIETCKSVVLDKSTCTAACHAKEAAWFKIAKAFNSKGFKHERSIESLKMKWDNLKKISKKLSKNVFDMSQNEFDDVTTRTVEMLYEAEKINNSFEKTMESEEVLNESKDQIKPQDWNAEEDDDSQYDNDGDKGSKRSINFSPQECNLLLQCVKPEKKFVMTKATTSGANKLKNRAWFRITNNYNRLSPQKRSTKVLRTKFTNMKNMAKSLNFKDYIKDFNKKRNKLIEDDDNKIKSEPMYEFKENSEPEFDDIDDDYNGDNQKSKNDINIIPDPLSTAVNGDSGIDLINPIENKEVVRLKMELLHYKMETAKLERKRIEEALRAQSLENSLRLRTARLEATAAADRLRPDHPARAFTLLEAAAEHYLAQCT